MIPKISRGSRPGGLLAYLLGPGRFNEHRNPHVVGSWDGVPELHQVPVEVDGDGRVVSVDDAALWGLTGDLSDPAVAAGVPLRAPDKQPGRKVPQGPVWHCSLRNHEEDRPLSDEEWAQVVEDLMHRTGIAPRGDLGACRWVAVRHAQDHVHVVAVLVRQDNGRRVHPYNDYFRAQEACTAAEQRLGLRPTSAADRTAVRQSTRAELEKAARRGVGETSREWLRRAARVAAVQAQDPEEFFSRLNDLGVLCRPREVPAGQLSGYVVADPDDLDAQGEPIWFGGRSLARDLSLPQLLKRWTSAPAPPSPVPPTPRERASVGREERRVALHDAAEATQAAAAAVRTADPDTAAAIGHAAGDLLTAVGALTQQGRPLERWEPAELFDRATRQPGVGQPAPTGSAARDEGRWPPVAAHLRTAAWRLAGIRTLTGRDATGYAELLVALAALLAELAALHEQRRQTAHAMASRDAGTSLRAGAPARPRAPLPHARRGARPPAAAPAAPARGATEGPGRARSGARDVPDAGSAGPSR